MRDEKETDTRTPAQAQGSPPTARRIRRENDLGRGQKFWKSSKDELTLEQALVSVFICSTGVSPASTVRLTPCETQE